MANKVELGELYSFISKKNGCKYIGSLIKIDPVIRTITLGQVVHLGTEGRLGGGPAEIQPDFNEQQFLIVPSDEIFYFARELPETLDKARKETSRNSVFSNPSISNQNDIQQQQQMNQGYPNRGYNQAPQPIPQPLSVPSSNSREPKNDLSAPTYVDPSAPSEKKSYQTQENSFNTRNNYQNQPRNQNNRPRRNNQENYVPQGDFDFQSYNAQFNKSELGKEFQTDLEPDTDIISDHGDKKGFYDRKNSFFDNISCDSKEKNNRRDFRAFSQQERHTNSETFGENFVQRNNFNRFNGRGNFRGNHRGGRGRGGYQSRGGRGNFNGHSHSEFNPNSQ